MKKKPTKIVELVISDESQEMTIDAISLVTSPAIEQDFVFFGKEKNNLTLAKIDEEKRMLVSPALIPNKNIFRYDPNTDSDYYVYFSKETVRRSSELYLEHNNHHKATYQHEDKVSGVLTVESWIIEDTKKDKSTLYGFSLPVGTWMVKLRIDNDEMWNKIKSGELKGLSIEGYFINKMEKMGKQQFSNEDILEALSELIKEKTELKAEKIELSLAKEIDKSVKKSEAIIKKSKNLVKKIEKIAKSYNDLWEQTRVLSEDIEGRMNINYSIASDAERAAKELGVNINDIKGISVLENIDEKLSREINMLKLPSIR